MVYLSSIAVCCSSDVCCINSFRHSLVLVCVRSLLPVVSLVTSDLCFQ